MKNSFVLFGREWDWNTVWATLVSVAGMIVQNAPQLTGFVPPEAQKVAGYVVTIAGAILYINSHRPRPVLPNTPASLLAATAGSIGPPPVAWADIPHDQASSAFQAKVNVPAKIAFPDDTKVLPVVPPAT